MEVKKTDCENKEKCYLNMVYGMLANIGNRTMSMPNCNDCNAYKPSKEGGRMMADNEYICAKDLDDFRNEIVDKFLKLCNYNDFNRLSLVRICETIDEIYNKHSYKELPDVEEVKHGRWSNNHCTECGKLNPTTDLNEFTMKWFSRYLPRCPYCGAKMDGGKAE